MSSQMLGLVSQLQESSHNVTSPMDLQIFFFSFPKFPAVSAVEQNATGSDPGDLCLVMLQHKLTQIPV